MVDGEHNLNCVDWAKKVTGAATISVGPVGLDNDGTHAFAREGAAPASLQRLIERMEREEFDLIAVGRTLLSDPNGVKKVENDNYSELNGFDPASLANFV